MFRVYIVFLLLMTYTGISFQFFFSEEILAVTPVNAFAYIGSELVLNCTPTAKYMDKINASDLYFSRWNDVRISDEFVHLLSEQNIAQLKIQITNSTDGSHYRCVNGKNPLQSGVTDVCVEYYPRPVENISCVVYNWETMKCNWDLGNYNNLDNIEVDTFWTSQSGNFNYTCSSSTKTSCYFDKKDYNEANKYYIYISIKHKETQVESPRNDIVPSLVVKPAAVIQLEGIEENATCIQMQWNHTEALRNMVYKIQYKSKWNEEIKILMTNSTKYLLCDLHPYTIYDITVTAKPHLEGFWSDVKKLEIKTIEDVPSSGPKTVNGSFYTDKCIGKNRFVYIFFKHVSEFNRNGVITKYKAVVNKVNKDSGVRNEENTLPENYKIRIFVECDAEYIVELIAVNKAGSSTNNSKIYIPRESVGDVDINLSISVSNETSMVIAHWMPSTQSIKPQSYVLHWCNNSSPRVCQDDIYWKTVHGDERNQTLPVAAANVLAKNYLFAISSVDENGVASRMSFSQCLYVATAVPDKPPEGFRINDKNPELTIGVSWLSNPCDTQTLVAIQYYVLHYCNTDQEGNCGGPAEMEKVESSVSNYQIDNLSAGVNYSIWMQAESNGILGPETERLFAIPKDSVYLGGLIAGIIIAVLFALGVFVVLLYRCRNNIKAICKKYEVDNPIHTIDKTMPQNLDYIENGKFRNNLSDFFFQDKIDSNNVHVEKDLMNEQNIPDENSISTDSKSKSTNSSQSNNSFNYNKFAVASSDESNRSDSTKGSKPESDHPLPTSIVNKNGYLPMNEVKQANMASEVNVSYTSMPYENSLINKHCFQKSSNMSQNERIHKNENYIAHDPKLLFNRIEVKESNYESLPEKVPIDALNLSQGVKNTTSTDYIKEEKGIILSLTDGATKCVSNGKEVVPDSPPLCEPITGDYVKFDLDSNNLSSVKSNPKTNANVV